jgi:hypothetical protein
MPLYESEYSQLIREAYIQWPILREIFSIEDILQNAVIFSGILVSLGGAVMFTIYHAIPDKSSSINQVIDKLSFVFEGPSKLMFFCGFLLLGISGAAFSQHKFEPGFAVALLALFVCVLPATYFRWQSKFAINDRPWLRKKSFVLAKICGFVGIAGATYLFIDSHITFIKVMAVMANTLI